MDAEFGPFDVTIVWVLELASAPDYEACPHFTLVGMQQNIFSIGFDAPNVDASHHRQIESSCCLIEIGGVFRSARVLAFQGKARRAIEADSVEIGQAECVAGRRERDESHAVWPGPKRCADFLAFEDVNIRDGEITQDISFRGRQNGTVMFVPDCLQVHARTSS